MAGQKLYISDTLSRNFNQKENGQDGVKTICFYDMDKVAAKETMNDIIMRNEKEYDYLKEVVPAVEYTLKNCPEKMVYVDEEVPGETLGNGQTLFCGD
jgi:hypothetical protein